MHVYRAHHTVLAQQRRDHERAKAPLLASLLDPDPEAGRYFLVYDNFRVILKWNRSDLFALAVGTLADRLEESE